MVVSFYALLGAAAAAFVVGGLWYSPALFGKSYLTLRGLDSTAAGAMSMPEVAGELARCVLLAWVMAQLLARGGESGVLTALTFGGWMWVAIYTALAGSVLHEGVPWRLYAIHAGDGLAKMLVMATILGW